MMKILTGVLPPTDGKIIVDGTEMKRYTTKEAKEAGIACAYQDLSLCTNLSVYENFAMLNVEHRKFTKPGWRKTAKKETKEVCMFLLKRGLNNLPGITHINYKKATAGLKTHLLLNM